MGEPGGDKESEVAPQHRDDDNNLNKGTMAALAGGVFLLLGWNIIFDSLSEGYEGYPVTLVLSGLLGGIIGRRYLWGGGGK